MRIVVVCPLPVEADAITTYYCELLAHLAIAENYTVTEIAGNIKEPLTDNAICFIYDKPKNELLKTAWLQFQLPSTIKKLQADVVLQLIGATSSKISVPQIVVVPSAEYLTQRKFAVQWKKYLKTSLFKQIPKANKIIAPSGSVAHILKKDYDATKEKTEIIFPLPFKQITELSWQEREAVKREWTGGAEFFYSDASFASENEVLEFLKSYSVFQKWQQSSMMLVIKVADKSIFEEKLSTYKFRLLIALIDTDEEITGAAYAIIQPFENINVPAIMKAVQQQVVVMVRDSADLPELPADCFIKIENDIETLGKEMGSIYKKEQARNNMAAAAGSWLQNIPQQQQPRHLWKLLTVPNS
jgi:hypothetical protein